jgi:hypothetical protein
MIYRVTLLADLEDYEESDNPQTAKDDLQRLRQEFPSNHYMVLRDGKEITDTQLEDDVALQDDFNKKAKVPAGYRSGKYGEIYDLGISPEDTPTSVWKPPNPADEYE